MSNAPEIPPAVAMQQLLSGYQVSQALFVVAELGVATALLDGPLAVPELARVTGAHEDSLRRILRFLAPLGVVTLDDDVVEVTAFGKTLADGPADSVRGMARYWAATHYLPFSDLVHTARTGEVAATRYLGKPFFEWVGESTELAEIQNSAMAGGSSIARGDLLRTYRLPAGHTVADIGGAKGILLAELLSNEPDRKGIVFDVPAVVSEAKKTLDDAGLSDRATTMGGDFFDSVPAAEVYTLSAVLHDWDDAACGRILASIAKAARQGARVVLFEMVVPEGSGPHFTKMVDIVMLAMVGGRERTGSQWRELLAASGFTLDRIVAGPAAHSAIEATLTTKPN